MPIKTHKIRLYPNTEMQSVLVELTDYGRYCWN
ncbi:helix-turn-helix domain-containing protein, partial [Schleiferilactobacillus shenzhenensis]